jgi:hypothetical protein
MSDIERGDYKYIEEALPGLLYGLDNQIEGGRSAKVEIEFGRPVCGYPGDEKSAYPYLQDAVSIEYDVDFVTSNSIEIVINGETVTVPFNTDQATTMNDIIVAIGNITAIEAEAVLDPDDTNNRTLVIRTKGATAVVTTTVTGGAAQAVGTITQTTAQIYLGISTRTDNAPGVYEQYCAVNVLVDGYVWGQVAGEVKANVEAYVGANGLLNNAGVAIGGIYFTNAAVDKLAVCQVTGKVPLGVAGLF